MVLPRVGNVCQGAQADLAVRVQAVRHELVAVEVVGALGSLAALALLGHHHAVLQRRHARAARLRIRPAHRYLGLKGFTILQQRHAHAARLRVRPAAPYLRGYEVEWSAVGCCT